MNSVRFLYAAYVATWVIQGAYIASMVRRYNTLRRRMRELAKSKR
jgi:CcmD family protein